MPDSVCIRRYESRDREAVRRIAVATALAGEPAIRFIDGDDVLADALTMYFTDYEPESCFVAERKDRVIGYIIGTVETRLLDRVFGQKIFWRLLWKALRSGFFVKPKNLILFWRCLISFFRCEFFVPDFSKDFPAALHINFLEEARGCGGGSVLIETYFSYLSERMVKGVRIATISPKAGEFFRKHGCSLIYQGRRSYFRHVVGQELPIFIFGKLFSY